MFYLIFSSLVHRFELQCFFPLSFPQFCPALLIDWEMQKTKCETKTKHCCWRSWNKPPPHRYQHTHTHACVREVIFSVSLGFELILKAIHVDFLLCVIIIIIKLSCCNYCYYQTCDVVIQYNPPMLADTPLLMFKTHVTWSYWTNEQNGSLNGGYTTSKLIKTRNFSPQKRMYASNF